MEWFFVGAYIGIALYLAWATMDWHVKHDSPPSHLLHDLAVSAVWPLDIAVRIYRVRR